MLVGELITKLIKEKKGFLIWIIAVALVSILFIYALISGNREDTNNNKVLFDTPLTSTTPYTVTMNKGVYEDKKLPSEIEVFNIKEANYSSDITTFLLSIGKGGLKKDNVDNALYTWSNSSDYVEYVADYQSLTGRFADPVSINANTQISSTDKGKEILEYIYSNYLGKEFKFKNVKVSQEGGKYRIEGNRVVNDMPLYLPTVDGFSDYIIVDDSSNLYQFQLTLVEYEEEGYERVKLVHPSNLSKIIKDPNYPKEVFQGYNPQIAEDLKKASANTQKGIDNVDSNYDLPSASFSTAKSVELVYYYSNSSFKQLTPAYRIVSEGEIVFNSKKYTVPVYIFANALDPERVYVPE